MTDSLTSSSSLPHGRRLHAPAASVLGAIALGVALSLAGCAGSPPKARVEEQQQQRDFAASGYAPAGAPVEIQAISWRLRGDDVRLSITTAGSPGVTPRPVVLYLPGLGETEAAGLRWRRAWAAAGYAVLSLQPLDEDAAAWSSDRARAAEFNELGRRHYADAEMRKRLARLDELLAEAQRLGRQGEAPWRAFDWSRAVVAGYELGAQAALALAGERQPDGAVLALKSLQPRAVIVISPQVMATPQPERYRELAIPVLSLTSPEDNDLLNNVKDTRWREAPFQAMPADRRWLLSVGEVAHAAFAGNEPRPETEGEAAMRRREEANQNQGPSQGRRGGGGGGRGGRGQEGPTRLAPVPAVPDYRRLHEQQLGLIAAQQVSVAFLDLQLRQSEAARAWLVGPAQAWLGRVGRLSGPAR
ncbi:hypothetical protein [Roseateles chitosanitabidus]|uniref:hypothetical protein n=1 Tax=Roseateles chitosanitabidus TaxID=65048 RepID=UPI000833BA5B|nr:hypothetical protein [Roseateles chitosanitabidus]